MSAPTTMHTLVRRYPTSFGPISFMFLCAVACLRPYFKSALSKGYAVLRGKCASSTRTTHAAGAAYERIVLTQGPPLRLHFSVRWSSLGYLFLLSFSSIKALKSTLSVGRTFRPYIMLAPGGAIQHSRCSRHLLYACSWGQQALDLKVSCSSSCSS